MIAETGNPKSIQLTFETRQWVVVGSTALGDDLRTLMDSSKQENETENYPSGSDNAGNATQNSASDIQPHLPSRT